MICCCRVLLHVDGLYVCYLPLELYLRHIQHLLVTHLPMLHTAACGTCRGLLLYCGFSTVATIDMQV